jgi:hypothetical protein
MSSIQSLRALKMSALALSVALMAACGGGNDDPLPGDPSSDPVSKYVGSWLSRCVSDSGASAHLRADFSKVSPTGIAGDVVAYAYVGTSCSGPSVREEKVLTNLNLTLVGPATVSGLAAERFTGTSDQGDGKVVLSVTGNQLRIGDPDEGRDAEGYPTSFYEEVLTRL